MILKVVGATGIIVYDLLVIPWPGTCPLPLNPQLTLQPFATYSSPRKNNCVLQLRKLNGLVKGLAGLRFTRRRNRMGKDHTFEQSRAQQQQLRCLSQQCFTPHALIRRNHLILLTSFSAKWVIDISQLCLALHG